MKIIKAQNNETIDLSKIGIIFNSAIQASNKTALEVQNILKSKDIQAEVFDLTNLKQGITFAIVIGGDGTILNAARFYCEAQTPIFGINLGRVGFLSQSTKDKLQFTIEKILKGEFSIDKRLMLSTFNNGITALNDIVIKGEGNHRTSHFFLYINKMLVCHYLADGLIVSTPTGSTAYNLSSGGPVLVPRLEAIIITPICPHTLNARPLVIPANEQIDISTNDTTTKLSICADGQITVSNKPNTSIKIQKYAQTTRLVVLQACENDFYTILREKLHWGIAPKNLGKQDD